MTVTVRFAPSPTGRLHIGNIRTALLNWLYAHKAGGTFVLRMDDTDFERSTEEFAQGIRDDLKWLGLTVDREERQSDRTERYDAVRDELKERGLLYPCYETADELDRKRKRQLARGLPPIYDRSALKLDDEARAKLEAEGRKPHWRFRLPNTDGKDSLKPAPTLVHWDDLVGGEQTVDLGSLSDPVLVRADGSYLYTLPSVIDDIDMKISHVIRGSDHVTNSGVQIAIFEALGAKPPAFAHHSLLIGADGQALSKRLGALSIETFRDEGLEPLAVACHAALIGTSDAIEPYPSLDALSEVFDTSKISQAPGRFDLDELRSLNARLLHGLEYAAVAGRLGDMGINEGEAFWLAVRGNLNLFSDCAEWWQVITDDIEPVSEDASLIEAGLQLLPDEPWDDTTWKAWTGAIKAETGKKGRALFHPLRLALTGRETGPEMKALLPLIGRERVEHRLRAAA